MIFEISIKSIIYIISTISTHTARWAGRTSPGLHSRLGWQSSTSARARPRPRWPGWWLSVACDHVLHCVQLCIYSGRRDIPNTLKTHRREEGLSCAAWPRPLLSLTTREVVMVTHWRLLQQPTVSARCVLYHRDNHNGDNGFFVGENQEDRECIPKVWSKWRWFPQLGWVCPGLLVDR